MHRRRPGSPRQLGRILGRGDNDEGCAARPEHARTVGTDRCAARDGRDAGRRRVGGQVGDGNQLPEPVLGPAAFPWGSQGVSEPPLAAGSAATVRCLSEGCRRRARCAGQGARTARVPLCLRAVPGCTHPIAHPLRAGLHSASFLLRHGPKGAGSAGGNGASAGCTPPSPAPAPRAAKLTQATKRGAKRGAAGGSRCVPRGVTPAGRLGAGALQSPGGRIWRRRRGASVG